MIPAAPFLPALSASAESDFHPPPPPHTKTKSKDVTPLGINQVQPEAEVIFTKRVEPELEVVVAQSAACAG
jgi:hypothetical protein